MKINRAYFLLIFFIPGLGLADWSKLPSREFSVPDYPAEGSAAYKRDYDTLVQLQDTRSEKDCALARSQRYPFFAVLFGESAGIFSESEIGALTPLFTKITKLSDRIADYFKHKFERPRPFTVDKRIVPCADKPEGSLSYPSSHTAIAAADACVLADLFPLRAKKILGYGNYLGDLRAIVGVHHPSDVEAGKELGKSICAHLLADEEFQLELKEIKKGL